MNNASGNNTVTHDNKHLIRKPKSEHDLTTTGGINSSSSTSVVDYERNPETEWRRNWQPDLKCCPWRILQADHYVYLVKANFLPDSYQFLITDLSHFWYESVTHSEFFESTSGERLFFFISNIKLY